METRAYLPFNKARAFAQVITPARCLLGCLYSAPICLSGTLKGCVVFSPCFVHDRRFTLYPGGTYMDNIGYNDH
jgi:hypothetical protein